MKRLLTLHKTIDGCQAAFAEFAKAKHAPVKRYPFQAENTPAASIHIMYSAGEQYVNLLLVCVKGPLKTPSRNFCLNLLVTENQQGYANVVSIWSNQREGHQTLEFPSSSETRSVRCC
ncbi:hypothetical protein BaRGS_00006256 [Batillaria attramentaria]|uniref:Uncharacterized protein n=1 Tax=Batillaria attramentaria TaxID=370345 RepID=A0ABD0LT15_9CAEN